MSLMIAVAVAIAVVAALIWKSPLNSSTDSGAEGAAAAKRFANIDCASVDSFPKHGPQAETVFPIPKWGSFRPDIYFGMKSTNTVVPSVSGMLWRAGPAAQREKFRHEPSQDEVDSFYWTRHNGRDFGEQSIKDSKMGVDITTTFFTGSDKFAYGQLVDVRGNKGKKAGNVNDLILYFSVECSEAVTSQCLKESFEFVGVYESPMIEQSSARVFNVISRSKTKDNLWSVYAIVIQDSELESGTCEGDDCISVDWSAWKEHDAWSGSRYIIDDSERPTTNRRPTKNSKFVFDENGSLNKKIEEFSSFAAVQIRSKRSFEAATFLFENVIADDVDEVKAKFAFNKKSDRSGNKLNIVEDLHKTFQNSREDFDRNFDKSFPLDKNMYDSRDRDVAKLALSTVLGGIGYFKGTPIIGNSIDVDQEVIDKEGIAKNRLSTESQSAQEPITLYTSNPSRTAFPRGFLWDEGFHQLLVSSFSPEISANIVNSWINAMYVCAADSSFNNASFSKPPCAGGWIPREMILGAAARRRVPDEFITQRVNIANPPTLLLVVDRLLDQAKTSANPQLLEALTRLFPGLNAWMKWFVTTQAGPLPGSFRWRGRAKSDKKFIPNTLASGLDDYPRSAFVSSDEYHVDLHSWLTKSFHIMSKFQELVQAQSEINYAKEYEYLSRRLDELHWSESLGSYHDVGYHSDHAFFDRKIVFRCENPSDGTSGDFPISVKLLQEAQMKAQRGEQPPQVCPRSHPQPKFPLGDGNGGYIMHEEMVVEPQYADSLFVQHIPRVGYVNIFPFLLKLVDGSDTTKLSSILESMEDPNALFSDFGLRSISKSDMFYRKKNAPGDEPYWRGPIWININYLAIGSLKHYSVSAADESIRRRCDTLYNKLRKGVTRNILDNFHRTGHLWEQYEDLSGKGIRGHPFAGWTALLANIMAEKY